uniref:Uncharacterized protein n=1 Tax=Amphimedon queenslandica TaxID=400682 RepID=A0A1X7UNQ2_AMPQE
MSTVDCALSTLPLLPPVRPPFVSPKLPKLTLNSFHGSLVAWTPFQDSFKSAIDDNPSMATIDKFSYCSLYWKVSHPRKVLQALPLLIPTFLLQLTYWRRDLAKRRESLQLIWTY